MEIRPDFGTAGLLVRLDEDVTLEGVVERGVLSLGVTVEVVEALRPVMETPRPRFVAGFGGVV